MTIIVNHRRTGNAYILLGINGEVDKVNPSRFISELFAQEKSEVSCSVTVCDVQGNIFLAYIDDLVVVEIDGKKIADILPEPTFEEKNNPRNNGVYSQQTDDFEDEADLATENLDNSDKTSTETTKTNVSAVSSTYRQSLPKQDDFEDDGEDWI